jgi:type III pantothenate kinase
MNLLIDIGNTKTKCSICNNDEIISSSPVNQITSEDIDNLKKKYPTLTKAIISSVKKYSPSLKNYLIQNFKPFIELNAYTPLPIENCYVSKDTLGNDRIAAAVGAYSLFPSTNLLVIDAGTAITYDIINDKNQFLGGNISPGLEMRFKALHHFTDNLPMVDKEQFNNLYGRTTEEAIRAGIQHGVVFEVDKTIDRFKEFYKNLKVIITGGDANFFDMKLKNSFFVNFNLTAIGLNCILEYNGEI